MGLKISSNNEIIIVHGDILFDKSSISQLNGERSLIVVANENQFEKNKIGINIVKGRASSLSFGISPKWGQILYLTGRELELMKKISSEKIRWFTHEGVNEIINNGGIVYAIESRGSLIKEINNNDNNI